MFNVINSLIGRCYCNKSSKLPFTLQKFRENFSVANDEWNDHKDSEVTLDYYDKDKTNPIATINYRKGVGQIGWFFIEEKYRQRGLEEQILKVVVDDIKTTGCASEIWEVTTQGNSIWTNLWHKSVWKCPAHSSVSGCGYSINIADAEAACGPENGAK